MWPSRPPHHLALQLMAGHGRYLAACTFHGDVPAASISPRLRWYTYQYSAQAHTRQALHAEGIRAYDEGLAELVASAVLPASADPSQGRPMIAKPKKRHRYGAFLRLYGPAVARTHACLVIPDSYEPHEDSPEGFARELDRERWLQKQAERWRRM